MSQILKQSINELVSENFIRASVLYYMGVKFYDYKTETLEEVCKANGLNVDSVIKSMDLIADEKESTQVQLKTYPAELLVEYLKHSHYLFVKKRLPYIGQLIDSIGEVNFRYKSLSEDLKSVFPLFVEDFIHHIYEEEDTLFTYINSLSAYLNERYPIAKVYQEMEKFSVKDFAVDHEVHQNEMEGFRKLTNNYQYCEEADLQIKVLFKELERFESDLMLHAKVENEILFPKAMHLERLVKLKFHENAKMN